MAGTAERTQQPQRPRPRFRSLEVRRVERLNPSLIRVTLAGEELAGFETPAPTQHLKLILPEPGQTRPTLPDPSLPRHAELPPGTPRPLMRTYTIRRVDAAAGELDIDFALHTDGPASTWAASAKPGDLAALAGPGGRRYEPDPSAAEYLIAGDETALPAMATLLATLPADMPVRLYAEIGSADEQLAWQTPARVESTWVPRKAGESAGAPLRATLLKAQRPAGDVRVWLACEATAMRRIRRDLLEGWQLDPAAIVTRGYWKQGEPNYRDGDYGED